MKKRGRMVTVTLCLPPQSSHCSTLCSLLHCCIHVLHLLLVLHVRLYCPLTFNYITKTEGKKALESLSRGLLSVSKALIYPNFTRVLLTKGFRGFHQFALQLWSYQCENSNCSMNQSDSLCLLRPSLKLRSMRLNTTLESKRFEPPIHDAAVSYAQSCSHPNSHGHKDQVVIFMYSKGFIISSSNRVRKAKLPFPS